MINKILYRLGLKLDCIYPRPAIKFIRKHFKGSRSLKGVEFGIYTGGNAKSMLKTLNIEKLYLVDPYKNYHPTYDTANFKKAKKKAHKLKRNSVQFIEDYSSNIFKYIDEKEKIDFVYIDANHNYSYVIKDIRIAFELVKDGGVIAGHDFNQDGVAKAVQQVCRHHNIIFSVEGNDWWFIK